MPLATSGRPIATASELENPLHNLHYRLATEPDAPLLAELNRQLIAEGADCGENNPGFLEKRMREWLSAKRYLAVVFSVYNSAEPVAYALFREHSKEIYLRQFMVAPHLRNQGVGREALRLLREKVWSSRKRLVVEALTTNAAGLAFWRSMGFCDYAVTLEIPHPDKRMI